MAALHRSRYWHSWCRCPWVANVGDRSVSPSRDSMALAEGTLFVLCDAGARMAISVPITRPVTGRTRVGPLMCRPLSLVIDLAPGGTFRSAGPSATTPGVAVSPPHFRTRHRPSPVHDCDRSRPRTDATGLRTRGHGLLLSRWRTRPRPASRGRGTAPVRQSRRPTGSPRPLTSRAARIPC